jgi:hypothetical protein
MALRSLAMIFLIVGLMMGRSLGQAIDVSSGATRVPPTGTACTEDRCSSNGGCAQCVTLRVNCIHGSNVRCLSNAAGTAGDTPQMRDVGCGQIDGWASFDSVSTSNGEVTAVFHNRSHDRWRLAEIQATCDESSEANPYNGPPPPGKGLCFYHSKGRFVYLGQLWQEFLDGHAIHQYGNTEIGSTTAIYLTDPIQDVTLAFPLNGGAAQVRSDDGSWRTSGYQVMPMSCGGNPCYVHSRGQFEPTLKWMWVEYYEGRRLNYAFEYAGSDDNFEYLFDTSRRLTLALPKKGGLAQVQTNGSAWASNGYFVRDCLGTVSGSSGDSRLSDSQKKSTSVKPSGGQDRRPSGGACNFNQECTSGNCLDHLCGGLKPDGQACTFNQECASTNCVSHLCGTLKPNGQSCNSNQECASKNCVDHSCGSLKRDSQVCTFNQECASANCVGHLCGTLKPSGQSCNSNQECASKNCVNHVCTVTH